MPCDVDIVAHAGQTLAIIVPGEYHQPGIHFFTPGHYSQQLAYMAHPTGKIIEAHTHNLVERNIQHTQEVLVLRRGRLRVDFYGPDEAYLESRELGPGDVILLAAGGHGFEVLEDVEMVEIKQGPYAGDQDKVRLACAKWPGSDGRA
jgi:mannose-6-phosphate isomerase-like protein (cupin superfamily)